METSTAIACLTLSTMITGRGEHEKWREVMIYSLDRGKEAGKEPHIESHASG